MSLLKIRGGDKQTDEQAQIDTQTDTDGYKDRQEGDLVSLILLLQNK
jgi:hypothetical protein